ncbi:platelet-activating factor acetylhydrolase, isoform II-domain-containing protein [Lyophyllum atratum]|nr:platelet-activating factor acetylhydrolase, isoform II-domain-containing protein [Lyophyllum atratum]
MFFLSEIPGRFPVGATTFLSRVPSPRPVGCIKLRNQQSDAPQSALILEEVAFTAYYPADASKLTKKGLDWVIRPVKESLRGFVRFSKIPHWVLWPIVYLFGSLIQIPVYPNASLANPKEAASSDKGETEIEQWPLVIFSHGLGGSRTAYSQICSRMAASGKVVLALEHRDGTGCACVMRVRGPDGRYQDKPILYYQEADVILEKTGTHDNPTPFPMRTDQLEFRREEIYTAYKTFCDFVQNNCSSELETIDNSHIDYNSWSCVDVTSGKGPVCLDANVTLAGHSFGGCTVLSILSTNPPPEYPYIPISRALILDPWLEPLPLPGPVPLLRTLSSLSDKSASTADSLNRTGDQALDDPSCHSQLPQILVINSETFTLWKDHYTRLQDVIKAWEPQGRRILTLVGSQHETFSDYPVLPLLRTAKAQTLMDVFSSLSIAFLDGNLEEVLSSTSTRKMEIEVVGKRKDGRPKRKLVGTVGDVLVT